MRPWNNAMAVAANWKFSPAGIVLLVPIRLSNGRSATATWPHMSVRPPCRRVPKLIRSRLPSVRTRKNKLPVRVKPRSTPGRGFFMYWRPLGTPKTRNRETRPEAQDNNFTSTALPRAEIPHDCRWPFSLDIFHGQAVITGAHRDQGAGERSRSNTSDHPKFITGGESSD
jgi:hypothetical protein